MDIAELGGKTEGINRLPISLYFLSIFLSSVSFSPSLQGADWHRGPSTEAGVCLMFGSVIWVSLLIRQTDALLTSHCAVLAVRACMRAFYLSSLCILPVCYRVFSFKCKLARSSGGPWQLSQGSWTPFKRRDRSCRCSTSNSYEQVLPINESMSHSAVGRNWKTPKCVSLELDNISTWCFISSDLFVAETIIFIRCLRGLSTNMWLKNRNVWIERHDSPWWGPLFLPASFPPSLAKALVSFIPNEGKGTGGYVPIAMPLLQDHAINRACLERNLWKEVLIWYKEGGAITASNKAWHSVCNSFLTCLHIRY